MAPTGLFTFVGFGFGAIQAGLFLYEAARSGAFDRLVVAEVLAERVTHVRANRGYYSLNIAHTDRVEAVEVGPVEILNPTIAADRERLIQAVAQANEIATAVPSVAFYSRGGAASVQAILAAGLTTRDGRPGPVIYAAENDSRAAEQLAEAVLPMVPWGPHASDVQKVQFVNTVIGKMSGVVPVSAPESPALRPIAPGEQQAFLVEAFNRILIDRIRLGSAAGFVRGLDLFIERESLKPFEEAKFYGHNAGHALAAYVGGLAGARWMADLGTLPGIPAFLRHAMAHEAGAALIARYAGADPLFTPDAFAAYCDDLLTRMVNPFLRDAVERVGRDPARKLGWDDRLVGVIRRAEEARVEPVCFRFGAAAALRTWLQERRPQGDWSQEDARRLLLALWAEPARGQPAGDPAAQAAMAAAIAATLPAVDAWLRDGCPDPLPYAQATRTAT